MQQQAITLIRSLVADIEACRVGVDRFALESVEMCAPVEVHWVNLGILVDEAKKLLEGLPAEQAAQPVPVPAASDRNIFAELRRASAISASDTDGEEVLVKRMDLLGDSLAGKHGTANVIQYRTTKVNATTGLALRHYSPLELLDAAPVGANGWRLRDGNFITLNYQLKPFFVVYGSSQLFQCLAEDREHALEQCKNAYPDEKVWCAVPGNENGDLVIEDITEDPTCCPKCGGRTDIGELPENWQVHVCLRCNWSFLANED